MSDLNPSENDRRLSQVLREWRVEPSLPAGFEARVWRRISAPKLTTAASLPAYFLARLDAWFSRPALAVSYLSVLLIAGLAAGSWQAQRESARVNHALARLYVQSVDPYQAPRH